MSAAPRRRRRARIAGGHAPGLPPGDEIARLNGDGARATSSSSALLADEAERRARACAAAGSSLTVAVDEARPASRSAPRSHSRAVRPGAHLRQPLRVLLHLPAAPGPAAEPVPEGRRLPAVVPLRELHHAHPLHRGRPRAGRHRAAVAAQRAASTPPIPTCGRDAAQPPRRHEPALAAGAARPRHRGARPGRACAPASTTATCSTTRSPACSTSTPSWRRCASCRSA